MAKKSGVTVKDMFWTLGSSHDIVVVCEAPDDETAFAFLLSVSSRGYVRSETLRALIKIKALTPECCFACSPHVPIKQESSMPCRRIACGIAAVVIALVSFDSATADEGLQPQTRQDLKSAMENEAFTSWKYTLFAEHARKEGKFVLAEILETTAGMEHGHFMEWARRSELVSEDWNNLANAIVGEYADDMAMYARLADRAEAAGDKEMAQRFREVRAEEEKHRDKFMKAQSTSFKPDKP